MTMINSGCVRLQEFFGTTEDEMAGWHHWLDGHEFEHAPGVGDAQGSQTCCSPMGLQRVRHDWVTELYWTDTSSIWATILVFHVLGFLRANRGELFQPDGCCMAGFLSFLNFLRTYQVMAYDVCDCWWLWHPLFTDWQGIFHLSRFKLSSLFMSLLNNFSSFYSDDVTDKDKGEKTKLRGVWQVIKMFMFKVWNIFYIFSF